MFYECCDKAKLLSSLFTDYRSACILCLHIVFILDLTRFFDLLSHDFYDFKCSVIVANLAVIIKQMLLCSLAVLLLFISLSHTHKGFYSLYFLCEWTDFSSYTVFASQCPPPYSHCCCILQLRDGKFA